MLDDMNLQLSDHTHGIRLLSDVELADVEHKISIYTRKLDTMAVDLDEREIQRILDKERLLQERTKQRRQRDEL